MKFETTHFKNLIINRLQEVQLKAQKEFEQNQSQLGIRFVVIDNLLPKIEA